MKSQKFAPELENLVDITKVKMDVMKPWIATRVTELLGIEDEVLINFIYGLLDGKVVNGKEIQITLTGFMEKNTGKFMKELWTLLLSAQNNPSGVPQQFLDARAAETKKKQVFLGTHSEVSLVNDLSLSYCFMIIILYVAGRSK
jgi:serine/arginine repetitive matrix protein 1